MGYIIKFCMYAINQLMKIVYKKKLKRYLKILSWILNLDKQIAFFYNDIDEI